MDKAPFPCWPRFFHLLFQLSFLALCGYWCFHLPSTGKAVLAIGLAAVLMTVWEMKWQHKAIWLSLVFFLAFLENKSIDKDRAHAKADQDAAFDIARSTANNVTQTLTNVGLLRNRLDDLSGQVERAEHGRDTKRVTQLIAEREATKKQLLLTLAPGVVSEMQYWANTWDSYDRDINRKMDQAIGRLPQSRSGPPEEEVTRIKESADKDRLVLNRWLTGQINPVMKNANYVREQLLQNAQTQENKKNATIFARVLAGDPINWAEMREVTKYMDNVVKQATH